MFQQFHQDMGALREPREGEHPWYERVVIIWNEDDATKNLEGHVSARDFFRMIRFNPYVFGNPIACHDLGDCGYHLYPSGWVHFWSYDADAVGIVVKEGVEFKSTIKPKTEEEKLLINILEDLADIT